MIFLLIFQMMKIRRLDTKHKILKLFGINVIAIKDEKEYNSDFYSLCLKEIKEDMEKKSKNTKD